MTTWVLLHSPLLGPGSWTPVAEVLRERGDRVTVPDLVPAPDGTGHARRQAELVVAAVASGPVTLAAHSGAGPLLPIVGDALAAAGVPVDKYVFVDAGLPHPGRPRSATFPEEMFAQLRAMSVDGCLPPWTSWWPEADLAELVPDPGRRAALVADSPPLPDTLFTEPLPDASDLANGRARYLLLSEAYGAEAAIAAGLGWPVRRLASTHLAPLTEPAAVADAMQALVAA